MAFRLKSGNRTSFKTMGGTDKSPAKDMKTGKYEHSFESPGKQRIGTEGQDQDKIFNDKGEHVGDWVGGKRVMHKVAKKAFGEATTEGATEFAESMVGIVGPKAKKESPGKQTDTTWADGTKKSAREIAFSKRHTAEKSTESAHGQLSDAEAEYQDDLRAAKKYWYKINGKKASKAEYIKYKNKPGGDEPGKQTNDPTVSLAKKSADKRIKINK